MPAYKGRFLIISMLMIGLIILGLSATDQVMKKITLYNEEDFFTYRIEGNIIKVDILGLHADLNKKETQDKLVNTYNYFKQKATGLIENIKKRKQWTNNSIWARMLSAC